MSNPYHFQCLRQPSDAISCVFLKVDIHILLYKHQIWLILTIWLIQGVTLKKKYPKISRFKKLLRENGHNSLNIRARALKIVAFDRELNSTKESSRNATLKLQEKSSKARFSLQHAIFFHLFCFFYVFFYFFKKLLILIFYFFNLKLNVISLLIARAPKNSVKRRWTPLETAKTSVTSKWA